MLPYVLLWYAYRPIAALQVDETTNKAAVHAMAGTRLAVHATFLVEIVLLTFFSLYYATLPPTDFEVGSTIRTDTEPFLVDRSGLGLVSTNIKGRLDALEGLGRGIFSASASLGTANVDALLTAKPMCTVMVSALDEDPGTYQTPRQHHAMVGKALDGVVSKVIQPLLDQLSDLTQVTIKTQTLAYGQLSSNAKEMSSSKRYVISSKDVRSFWSEHGNTISSSRRLSPRDESGGTCYLDLIVYVPKKDIIPLSIADKGPDGASEAFALPGKRGAVAIANLDLQSISDDTESAVISQEEVYAKALLKSTAYLIEYLRNVTGLSMVGDKTDILVREILRIKFEAALADLGAVWTVIEGASRMKVSAENGEEISSCLKNLQNAIDTAKSGDDLAALSAVNTALRMTQRLATDGDMMEQMYFPQDHYLAVFTPLILPLMLPLLLGLVREIKRYKKLSKGERCDDDDDDDDDDDEKTQEPTVDDSDKKTK